MPRFLQDDPPLLPAARKRALLDIGPARALAKAAWDQGEARAASGDLNGALAWLGRAHRMAPTDQNLAFALATVQLRAGQADEAARTFGGMARLHGGRECWTGLAAASLLGGQIDVARQAVAHALSGYTTDASLASVAAQIVAKAEWPGWCGVRGDGTLLVSTEGKLDIRLDGEAVAVQPGDTLPAEWRLARHLTVLSDGRELLGSPLAIQQLLHVEGFVERDASGVAGWAWMPGSPELDPELRVVIDPGGDAAPWSYGVTARDLLPVDGTRPLSRPRGFAVATPAWCEVHVLGADGRHLLGSPLPPMGAVMLPRPAAARPAFAAEPDLPVDVIVPVYRGFQVTLDCLAALRRTVAPPHRIVVVDDATPEAELAAALDRLAADGAIVLLRPAYAAARLGVPHRGGFPAAVNAGLRGAAGRHVVLLNADTLVAPGWLAALRAAACSAPDIGTATPFSNEASIFSIPDPGGGNPTPDVAGVRKLATLAARANAGRVVDVPTAHGFCMFIRRDCLEVTGPLEDALFAQGYGEENDFCERARKLGYRHVAVPGVYVAHRGGVSFGGAGADLLRRNLALLQARHADYAARVKDFIDADPLRPARRRLDAARWRDRPDARCAQSVLLVTHGGGGGTARIVADRVRVLRAEGVAPVVLRAKDGACEVGDGEGAYPNLTFVLPAEADALRRVLAAGHPAGAEIHHLLDHDHSLMQVVAVLRVPTEIWVHDYGWFCARLSFVTGEGRFCGEAPASVCETCLAQWGRGIDDPIAPAALRARSAADFRQARRVVVPSVDVARRVSRHVPGLVPDIMPWEPAPPFRRASVTPGPGPRRVAVIGAIGLEKGLDVLLACARDSAARNLALEFVVVGYSSDDRALLETGRVFITGEFRREEAAALIAAQRAHLAFLPSVWPETWCFALSDAWSVGLSAAVFDIGTPADRVRHSGGGWVLPLGLPAPRINDVLLGL